MGKFTCHVSGLVFGEELNGHQLGRKRLDGTSRDRELWEEERRSHEPDVRRQRTNTVYNRRGSSHEP